jgi:delta24-sterol reductase
MDQHQQLVSVISTCIMGKSEIARLLTNVVEIDLTYRIVLVEPNVTMQSLVRAVLPYGFIPSVVVPDTTVFNACMGPRSGSSSFRYGTSDLTVTSLEITKSPLSTLDIVTLLGISLVPAGPFVEVTFTPVDGIMSAKEALEKAVGDSSQDFIDGIMFSKVSGAIMTAKFSPTSTGIPKTKRQFNRSIWFHTYTRSVIDRECNIAAFAKPYCEVLPTETYLFRYGRPERVSAPFKTWLGLLGTSNLVHQNFSLPYHNFINFMDFIAIRVQAWPLWLCPVAYGGLWSMHRIDIGGLDLNSCINRREIDGRLRELDGHRYKN